MSRRIIVSLFALGAITSVLAEPQLQSDAPDQISVATSSDEDTTSDLAIVQNSFDFWFHEMRHEGSGLACDNIRTDWKAICNQGWLEDDTNNGNKFSLASTGWTIIILTVGAELFAKTNGKAGLERGKAAAEIKRILSHFDPDNWDSTTVPNWPRADQHGNFRKRYVKPTFDAASNITQLAPSAGPGSGADEGSTIDNAILIAAALFAGNYFNATGDGRDASKSSVWDLAWKVGKSIDWSYALPVAGYSRLWVPYPHCSVRMVSQKADDAITQPFSEYLIVFAVMSALDTSDSGKPGKFRQLYEDCYAGSVSSTATYWKTATWKGTSTYTDVSGQFKSSFVPQFQAFLTGTGNVNLADNFAKMFEADRGYFGAQVKDYCASHHDVKSFLKTGAAPTAPALCGGSAPEYFGLGPGPKVNTTSYDVLAVGEKNDDLMFSPAIMAGYLASKDLKHSDKENIRTTLQKLFQQVPYQTATGQRILWRYSAKDLGKMPNIVQDDYVNFVLGFATTFVGDDFFQKYAIA